MFVTCCTSTAPKEGRLSPRRETCRLQDVTCTTWKTTNWTLTHLTWSEICVLNLMSLLNLYRSMERLHSSPFLQPSIELNVHVSPFLRSGEKQGVCHRLFPFQAIFEGLCAEVDGPGVFKRLVVLEKCRNWQKHLQRVLLKHLTYTIAYKLLSSYDYTVHILFCTFPLSITVHTFHVFEIRTKR